MPHLLSALLHRRRRATVQQHARDRPAGYIHHGRHRTPAEASSREPGPQITPRLVPSVGPDSSTPSRDGSSCQPVRRPSRRFVRCLVRPAIPNHRRGPGPVPPPCDPCLGAAAIEGHPAGLKIIQRRPGDCDAATSLAPARPRRSTWMRAQGWTSRCMASTSCYDSD